MFRYASPCLCSCTSEIVTKHMFEHLTFTLIISSLFLIFWLLCCILYNLYLNALPNFLPDLSVEFYFYLHIRNSFWFSFKSVLLNSFFWLPLVFSVLAFISLNSILFKICLITLISEIYVIVSVVCFCKSLFTVPCLLTCTLWCSLSVVYM